MTQKINGLVATASKAYGYSYTSLADIANAGYELPKMKTVTEDGADYVYWFDKDLKEWLRGAQVVVPEMKGMNKAQLYGSALTYARRYTAFLALQIASADDKYFEAQEPKEPQNVAQKGGKEATEQEIATARQQMFKEKQKEDFTLTDAERNWLVKHYKLTSPDFITPDMVRDLKKAQEERRNANR